MLRLTLLTSAVASATFVGTLAFAPAVIEVGQRLAFGQAELARTSPPAVVAQQDPVCWSPFAKILAALRGEQCS